MSPFTRAPARGGQIGRGWQVVAERELADLWWGGRGQVLILGYTLVLSATTYLVATNQAMNFLEQREATSLTVQLAVAFSGLLVLLAAADGISGERERGTLEGLLLTPVPRRAVVAGKAIAALSLWVAASVVGLPYLVYLGHGVDVVLLSVGAGLVVGLALSLFLAGYGLAISLVSRSNRLSLSTALFSLLAMYAPTQMPAAAQNGTIGEILLRLDPFTAGLHYLSSVVVAGHSPVLESGWLIGPFGAAALALVVCSRLSDRLALHPWGRP